MPRHSLDRSEDFEKAIKEAALANSKRAPSDKTKYVLRLYVSGTTPKSTRAIQNLRDLCEKHLAGRYDLEIIDVYQQPELAQSANLIAAPTLIKQLPSPLRKFVGDLSNTEKVLMGLDIHSRVSDADKPGGKE